MIVLEVLAFAATAILAVLWILYPDVNWEAWIVLFGLTGVATELHRRFAPKNDGINHFGAQGRTLWKSDDATWLSVNVITHSLSESLPRALRFAKQIGDADFEHWVRLELYGYSSEGGMLDSDTVPEYRAATGRWMDAYDRVLDLSEYPDLSIVNAYRFRFGVAKLEALAQRTEMQNIADEGIISLLRKHFSIEVVRFCFNPVEIREILEGIRNRLIERLHDIELQSAQKSM